MRRPAAAIVSVLCLVAVGAIGGVATAASGPEGSRALGATASGSVSAAVTAPHASGSIDGIVQRTTTAVSPLLPETVLVADPALPKDQLQLRQDGVEGMVRTTVRTTTYQGSVIRHEVVSDDMVQPIAKIVAVGTMSEPPPGVWDRLAQCESNGNWSINTGNGYFGGLQFNAQTWRAMGGTGLPHEHSRADQIGLAERLRDRNGGYGAWPACARKLGLPR